MSRTEIIKNTLYWEKLKVGAKVTLYAQDFIRFCSLSPSAIEVLNRMIKLTPRSVVDPVEYFVEYTYKDFEFLIKPNFYRARKELVEAGFIHLDGKAFYVRHDVINHTSYKQYQLLMKHFAVGPNYKNNIPDPPKR